MTLEEVLATFVGQIAWLPTRSLGSFVTMESGAPYLITREPISRPNVSVSLARRRVTVRGEQHLWIQADDWTLDSPTWRTSSSDEPLVMSQRLERLAGSRLIDAQATAGGTIFSFEFGETLTIRPDQDPSQTSWSIFWKTGGNASWLSRGELHVEL